MSDVVRCSTSRCTLHLEWKLMRKKRFQILKLGKSCSVFRGAQDNQCVGHLNFFSVVYQKRELVAPDLPSPVQRLEDREKSSCAPALFHNSQSALRRLIAVSVDECLISSAKHVIVLYFVLSLVYC